jgi:hypothetical protein
MAEQLDQHKKDMIDNIVNHINGIIKTLNKCKNCKEIEMAGMKLQEAMFWANHAILTEKESVISQHKIIS